MNPIEVYDNVSASQLSLARNYMAATIDGSRYIYIPRTDQLVREDVLKARQAAELAAVRERRQQQKAQQGNLL
jgi:hypothetical protein